MKVLMPRSKRLEVTPNQKRAEAPLCLAAHLKSICKSAVSNPSVLFNEIKPESQT